MSAHPNLFMQPLGTDFAAALVAGLRARHAGQSPDALARVTLIVNTSRMKRRIQSLFQDGPPLLQPRCLLLAETDKLLDNPPPPARPKLERLLQLAELIRPVLEQRPDLGPRTALYPLSESLAALMDEMQGEGVCAEDIAALDVSDQSDHWDFAKTLITVAHEYVSKVGGGQDSEARQRSVTEALIAQWAERPPVHPILLAGSTGSRGTTALLMDAIARLEKGSVVLPGFDPHMPNAVWERLQNALTGEDHPQFRFARLLTRLEVAPSDVPIWHDMPNVAEDRARVLSLAMRPAPVTDAWLREADTLPDLPDAMAGVTLLEAEHQREEALCIAMRLRAASEAGQTAALITPDRMLSRQVAATLDQWNIEPDDSAGRPLHLSPPGRLLRHVAELLMRRLDAELLLTLLKHPLTQSGREGSNHGLFTQILEDLLRRDSIPYPDADRLEEMIAKAAGRKGVPAGMENWGAWLCSTLPFEPVSGTRRLGDWIEQLRQCAEALCAGGPAGSGALWTKSAGEEARAALSKLEESKEHGGEMEARDFAALLNGTLQEGEIRDRDAPHPGVMIWGTLEARVQGAELVILGSLNDGIWPEAMQADPWMNRQLRHQAGLLLPDRKIGLAAHDFQQATCAQEVWITRATKLDDAETVPSRWINRLKNLICGTPERRGPEAFASMTRRGQDWRDKAARFEAVEKVPAATRAAPRPPVAARPRDFSVTEIKHLIRDPYAIYAKHCLKLRPLKSLVQEPDPPIKGIIIHEIMERFVRETITDPGLLTRAHLLSVADDVLAERAPWPTARAQWRAGLTRVADWFLEHEIARRADSVPAYFEADARGTIALEAVGGRLTGIADRIDTLTDGSGVRLYDYKSGSPPGKPEQTHFDKQLLLEAAILEQGGIHALGPVPVEAATYIGLGANPKEVPAPLDDDPPAEVLAGLVALIAAYLDPAQHYSSRRMVKKEAVLGDYDHLARFGEWDASDPPEPEDVG